MDEARWVTVFQGKPSKLEVLRGRLEEQEIETFVPDQLTKMVDPFITGPNPLEYRLQVPEADAARAREILATPVVAASGEEDEDDDEEDDGDGADDTPEEIVEISALRTIGLAVFLVTAPLAILAGLEYLWNVRHHGVRSKKHGLVVAATWFSVVLTLAVVIHLVAWKPKPPWHPDSLPPEPPSLPPAGSPFGG